MLEFAMWLATIVIYTLMGVFALILTRWAVIFLWAFVDEYLFGETENKP